MNLQIHLEAHRQGLPLVGLDAEIESVLTARQERLAHYSGVEKFRPTGPQPAPSGGTPRHSVSL
jgi:hypothetical protein